MHRSRDTQVVDKTKFNCLSNQLNRSFVPRADYAKYLDAHLNTQLNYKMDVKKKKNYIHVASAELVDFSHCSILSQSA